MIRWLAAAALALALPSPAQAGDDHGAKPSTHGAASGTRARKATRASRKAKAKVKRAHPGEPLAVMLTQYCLTGTTRTSNATRPGIVAADPRVFPLARYVDVYLDGKKLGRYLVDDTGGKVRGAMLDVWTPSCDDALEFGRRRGTAVLVGHPDRHARHRRTAHAEE